VASTPAKPGNEDPVLDISASKRRFMCSNIRDILASRQSHNYSWSAQTSEPTPLTFEQWQKVRIPKFTAYLYNFGFTNCPSSFYFIFAFWKFLRNHEMLALLHNSAWSVKINPWWYVYYSMPRIYDRLCHAVLGGDGTNYDDTDEGLFCPQFSGATNAAFRIVSCSSSKPRWCPKSERTRLTNTFQFPFISRVQINHETSVQQTSCLYLSSSREKRKKINKRKQDPLIWFFWSKSNAPPYWSL
jgi:hypothetical protein